MIVTDHPRQFPFPIFQAFPDMDEFERAAIHFAVLFVAEFVPADLNGAIIPDRMDLRGAGKQLAMQDIITIKKLFGRLHILFVVRQAALIVIELQILGKQNAQSFLVPVIESRKKEAVHAEYFLLELGLPGFGRILGRKGRTQPQGCQNGNQYQILGKFHL